MKRTLFLLAVWLLLLSFFVPGCRLTQKEFAFSYEIEKTEYSPGETVKIYVTVKNSGEKIEIKEPLNNYFGAAQLRDDTGAVLSCHTMAYLPAEHEDIFERGQSASYTYSFDIPENMSAGSLDLTISFMDEVHTFDNVFIVCE